MSTCPDCHTAEGYLSYLGQKIDQCKTHWEHYGQAASKAYATAWHSQDDLLTRVKQQIEARMEKERAMMTFLLSLVTVGVAGGLAGAAAKTALANAGVKTAIAEAGVDLTEERIKETVKWAEEKAKEPTKKGTEWLVKRLEPPASEDVFKPAGISPDQYGPQLLEGIEAQVGMLQDLLVGLRESNRVTLQGAKALTETIVDRTFVRDMPSLAITSDLLTPKAALALWMGWAWTKAQPDLGINSVYANDMTPILEGLRPLGVPMTLVSRSYTNWNHTGRPKTFIYMSGFIEWSTSLAASNLLFSGLPKNADGFSQVLTQIRLAQVQAVTRRFIGG